MKHKIELGHGSGGLMTRELINEVFTKILDNRWLKAEGDSAVFKSEKEHIAFTTDSYVITPMFFPGGDLGKLAVCGTVNDLAVAGARPVYLTAGFILEEGLSLDVLQKIVKSMKKEADKAGVNVVAGDTKVVKKGQADGMYINTSGVGFVDNKFSGLAEGKLICKGDVILVNGSLGDHEAAIINARESLFETSPLISDCASLNGMVGSLLEQCSSVRFMRDITRGGLAGILQEIADMTNQGVEIREEWLPFSDPVTAFCETLGYEPLHFANEGKCILVVSPEEAGKALALMQAHEHGRNAARIGEITAEHPGGIVMETSVGGKRIIEPPVAEKVPRIC
ncbi:MAG: hydrogenase expression/formation protein HypE [Bacteroidales bacterium]|nr:hydrogenase expression/formation protein HypE [Bacteroidales bacterium]MCF8328671.1 hydrogenase expression/formation protein HypE [Bacteroidales bacterium]